MRMSSVRALKEEIASQIVEPLVERELSARSFGIEATSMRRARAASRGIALGIARAGTDDYQLAVRVQRRALSEGSGLIAQIMQRASGEVDVRYVGQIFKQAPWHQSRQRPMLIGNSVAHFRVTAGTAGAFLRRRDGSLVVLSNNHVLAHEDKAAVGDAILQPGRYDGGIDPADRVGTLSESIRLRRSDNLVDAAVATVMQDISVDPFLLTGIGTLAGRSATPVQPGDRVSKVGRTTGVTHGIVTAVELDDVVVNYDRGPLSFNQQIEIEGTGSSAFSAGGDSGSLIVNAARQGVGLLFAGGDQGGSNGKGLTYANDLDHVVGLLGLTFPA
jgi:hypothetical protein